MQREYTKDEIIGLLLWMVGDIMDCIETIVERYPIKHGLAEMTKKEISIENASMSVATFAGQLEDMGLDYEKLIDVTNNITKYHYLQYYDLCKKEIKND